MTSAVKRVGLDGGRKSVWPIELCGWLMQSCGGVAVHAGDFGCDFQSHGRSPACVVRAGRAFYCVDFIC